MKTVYLETDPRPVEDVVTAEGGMERADRSTYMGVNIEALEALTREAPHYVWGAGTGGPHYSAGGGSVSAPKMNPAYTGQLVNSAEVIYDDYDALRRALIPPIAGHRCRSVLTPIEGI